MLQQKALDLNGWQASQVEYEAGRSATSQDQKSKQGLPFEQHCFSAMHHCGISLLAFMAEDQALLDPLKYLILNVEEQIRKFQIQDAYHVEASKLDLFGVIDSLETLWYVADFRYIQAKKNRLKRRLSEWAPASYLIEGALKDLFHMSTLSPITHDAKRKIQTKLAGYYSLRNRMVQANLGLVYSVANRFRHLGIAYEDLVQEGYLGLIKAVERFDGAKGFRFSTYAHIVISQSIHLAVDKQAKLVRLPYKALREKASVERVNQSLSQKLGRSPSICELEANLPDSLEYKSIHIANMVEPNANSQTLYESAIDSEQLEEMSPLEQDIKTSTLTHSDLVDRCLARLDERESYIVRMRYGLGLSKEYSLEEISLAIGLSRERIRQISHHAIEKLGRGLRCEI